jgi:predicted metal-dependent phosphoesterase TrpH
MKLDLHNHTTHSDSTATPEQLIMRGKALGIIPAITDHNTTAAEKEAREASKRYHWPFIMGEEILTTEGEITGLMLNEQIPRGLSPEETLEMIKEQGAVSYAPHPFSLTRFGIGYNAGILRKIDIIEVINARATRASDAKALKFAEKNRKTMGAGSDSHWLGGFGAAYVKTEDAEITTPKGLLKAVRKGAPVLARRISKLENLYHRIRRTLKLKG